MKFLVIVVILLSSACLYAASAPHDSNGILEYTRQQETLDLPYEVTIDQDSKTHVFKLLNDDPPLLGRFARQVRIEKPITTFNNGKTTVSGMGSLNTLGTPSGSVGAKIEHNFNKNLYGFGQGEVRGYYSNGGLRYGGYNALAGIGLRFK